MMSQPLRSPDPELQNLRHLYNRLCARFAEAADIDPVSAAQTVQELQDLSDRIVAIEVEAEITARGDIRGEHRRTAAAKSEEPDLATGDETETPIAGIRKTQHRPGPEVAREDVTANIIAFHTTREIRDGHGTHQEPPPSPDLPAKETDTADDGDAALGAAMQDWLKRYDRTGQHPVTDGEPEPQDETPELGETGPEATGPEATEHEPTWPDAMATEGAAEDSQAFDFDRLYDVIATQEAQIAAVLRRCEEHQRQLEAMERRLAGRHPAALLAPQLEALGAGLDQQRRRITALAIAIQRLLQWLAAERHRRGG